MDVPRGYATITCTKLNLAPLTTTPISHQTGYFTTSFIKWHHTHSYHLSKETGIILDFFSSFLTNPATMCHHQIFWFHSLVYVESIRVIQYGMPSKLCHRAPSSNRWILMQRTCKTIHNIWWDIQRLIKQSCITRYAKRWSGVWKKNFNRLK